MGRFPSAVPKVLDRYQLVARIGQGGMAQVFHARLQGIGGFERDVAVKVLLPEYSSEPDFVHMLLDEARIAGAIGHPCVVGVLDVGRYEELFYLVMEFVDGGDLRSLLRGAPGGRIPLECALYIVGEVLRGLHAVHTATDAEGVPRKIVHRDVSPANVLVSRAGVVKLGDFGIAHASSRITHTRPGAIKGKLRYMAPEQLHGQPVDHRADLYAVGIVLCEMLLGLEACEPKRMTPFGRVFTWSRRMHEGRVPTDVADLLDRAVADDPRARFADASQFRKALMQALHRRAPGYASDELARDLARLGPRVRARGNEPTEVATDPEGGVHEQLDVSDSAALFTEEQKPTAPFRPVAPAALPPPEPPPFYSDLAEPFPEPLPIRRTGGSWKKVGLVAGGAVASIVSVALAISIGTSSSSSALAAPAAPPVPYARPLPSVQPATGTLSVQGPSGTSVMIGSTAYPPAPCQLELPAGRYLVRLKRHHARAVTRDVVIEPGRELALRL